MSSDYAIELNNVWKRYSTKVVFHNSLREKIVGMFSGTNEQEGLREGEFWALQGVDISVSMGECVGIYGPNGSGKTTPMRMLPSYYTPEAGRINITGLDTKNNDVATRQHIGYLPENNPLYGEMLVRDYLAFVANLRGMSAAERKRNLDQTLQEAGLTEVYYRPISQLSKGYRQRVGLAQAILHLPAILVLDEPTEGLDPNQRLTIRDLIRSLGKERTVLLSTHVMQEVENTCERVLVINRGRLIADSPVQDLLKKAEGMRSVYVEVEGSEVESALAKLDSVTSVERQAPVDGRKRYVVSIDGDQDIRPEIFRLAKQRDWILWELHEEVAHLEDVFHHLTAEGGVNE